MTLIRTRVASATLLLTLLVAPASHAQTALQNLIKKTQPAIVTVIGYDEEGNPLQIGTGFFISRRGHLVTNRHVLAGAFRADVKGASGRIYPVSRVLAEDREGDLLKVEVDIPMIRVRTLKVAETLPEPGEPVVVIGSPYGLEQTVSDGIVSTVRDIGDVGKVVQITAPISSGSSGSPVMNRKGEVLGVATVQVASGQNLNFAMPASRVRALKTVESLSFGDWAAATFRDAGLRAAAAGDFDESRAGYESALKLAESADAYDGLGMALHAMGSYDEALQAYERALEIDPRHAASHFHLGELYEKQNEWTKARQTYESAIRIRPDYTEARVNAALVALQMGDRESAEHHYELVRGVESIQVERLRKELENPGGDGAQ